jgi:hypothetical protein
MYLTQRFISKCEKSKKWICIFIQKMLDLYSKQNQQEGEPMSVSNEIYKVGDTYTSQKSKATGVIKEIVPQANGNVRVKLDVNGSTRWTTWTAKS